MATLTLLDILASQSIDIVIPSVNYIFTGSIQPQTASTALQPNISIISPFQDPSGFIRATDISQCYTINDLSSEGKLYTYSVGIAPESSSRMLTIKNNVLNNSLFVVITLPTFLKFENNTSDSKFTISPTGSIDIPIIIDEQKALDSISQNISIPSSNLIVDVDVLDIIGPVYVPIQ